MLKTNLNNLIAKAKLKEAIELFKSQHIEDSDILTGINAVSQTFYTLVNEVIHGKIDKEDEIRQNSIITHRLQTLIGQLPDDKPTPAPFRNVPTDYDTHSDIAHLSKRPRNHAEDIASLGKYMPELDNRVKDLKHYSQFDDVAMTSAAINRVMSDVFNPFLKTVADSTHLRHLEDEVNFQEIAFSDELMPKTRLMIAELREHPTPASRYKRNLVISALTLSLVRKFDNSKFYVLSDFIADAEPFVWKRALVGLHFALSGREEDIDSFLNDKLKRLCANEDVQKVLEDIEIIIKNKDYELADKADNPFSNINNDPFFKASPHNWFMEFRADHPSVKTAIKNAEVLSLLEIAPDLPTNAFRYAFALNYTQYNAEQKASILDKAKTRKTFLEKRYPSVKEREKSRENLECERYTSELYFFYKMYNQDEYRDLLSKNISLYDSSLRDILFSDKCQNRISARIDYIEEKYESASEKFLKLNDNYEDDLIPALIGHCYLQHEDYEKALYYLKIAHTIEPLGIWNMNQIGRCYYSIENYTEALIWFLNANKIDNSSAYYLNHIGACYYFNEIKDYSESLKWFLKACEIDNNNAWNLKVIGDCYYFNENKDYNEALKWYLRAHEIENSNAWNLNQIGACYLFNEIKDYNEALKWFLRAYEIDKIDVLTLKRIGHCYYMNEKEYYTEALNWHLKAHEIENNNAWNLNQIGSCYYYDHNNNYEEALKWFLQAHKIENNNAWNLNRIGGCYYLNKKTDYTEALKWFLKAYEIENNNAWNWNRIGDCYYFNEKPNYSEALVCFLKAYEIEDNDAWNLNKIGKCYYLNKDYDKSLNWFLKAHEIENNNTQNLNYIGGSHYFNEKPDYNEALIWYLKAYEIKNNNAWNLNQIGRCYSEIKDYTKALHYFLISESIEVSQSLFVAIAYVYYKLKEKDKYDEYFNKSLAIEPKDAEYVGELGWLGLITENIAFAKENLEKSLELGGDEHDMMNLGHVNLIEQNKEAALELYRKSVKNYVSEERFFRGMSEDYQYLSPHGITEAEYAEIVAALRQFCAAKEGA